MPRALELGWWPPGKVPRGLEIQWLPRQGAKRVRNTVVAPARWQERVTALFPHGCTLATLSIQQTASQEQQRDEVLERPFSSSDVAERLLQPGLRVQGMGLAQNSADAEMQKQGVPVDDHHTLDLTLP
jgi:hypothetical protein